MAGAASGPRLVVAGTHSGVGKTTVATGLLAALRAAGHRPAPAKVGPDFIDPGYHALAAGRPGRNLDAWICGADAIVPLAARAASGGDVLVIEGVMGLFDGAVDGSASSTADVARLLDAPVVLVVDASALSGSVAALVSGYARFDERVRVGGVILNRVGSDGHEVLLREALTPLGIPVLGALRRDDALVWRDRHLGLVPVVENPAAIDRSLGRLAALIAASCDLDALMALARSAAPLDAPAAEPGRAAAARRVRVAIAGGAAFSFTYQDNLEALEGAGAELVAFDPRADDLPDGVHGLVAGGGFPEVFAAELGANDRLAATLRRRIAAADLAVWAECGGLLWLARSLDGRDLVGAVDAAGTMTGRLTLGYREADVLVDNPVAAAGATLRGHEFHYSTLDPPGAALRLRSRFGIRLEGHAAPDLLATYLHLHLGADDGPARRFVAACARLAAVPAPAPTVGS